MGSEYDPLLSRTTGYGLQSYTDEGGGTLATVATVATVVNGGNTPRLNQGGHSKFTALAALLFMCSLAIVAIATTCFLPSIKNDHPYLASATTSAGIAAILFFHIFRRRLTIEDPDNPDVQISRNESGLKDVLQNHISLIPLCLFCSITFVPDFLGLAALFSCNDVWYACGEPSYAIYKWAVITVFLYIAFKCSATIFCKNFYNAKFANTCGSNFGLMIIAFSTTTCLFQFLVIEVFERIRKELIIADNIPASLCVNPSNSTQEYHCLHGKTDLHLTKKKILPYVCPIATEYFLLVCESLFKNFFSGNSKTVNCHEVDANVQTPPDPTHQLNDYIPLVERVPKASNGKCFGLTIIFFPLVAILFCMFAYLDYSPRYKTDGKKHRTMFYLYSVCFYSAMTVCVVVCYGCMRKFDTNSKTITGLEYLVVFSAIGIIVDVLFNVSATISLTKCGYLSAGAGPQLPPVNNTCEIRNSNDTADLMVGPVLYLTHDASSLIQVFSQLPLLLSSQRVIKTWSSTSRVRLDLFQVSLLFLVVGNFAIWMVDSFFIYKEITPTSVMFGPSFKQYVFNTVTPFELFFRFNSALLFLQVFSRESRHRPAAVITE